MKFLIDPLDAVVAERQFSILFYTKQDKLGCPPPSYRKGDGSECWTANECLVCWQKYTKIRAMVEMGMIEKKKDE